MRPTARLSQAIRITLFTRSGCGLCDSAKTVLANLGARRSFAYSEVDINAVEAKGWRDLYDFDVPVVCLSGGVESLG
ncbi:glutaredoxin family protein [Candidatus Bathyarchaeota archaeon]|nr:glutaredoxin family protein [Candidatus Bathyarchaeota archaeon]